MVCYYVCISIGFCRTWNSKMDLRVTATADKGFYIVCVFDLPRSYGMQVSAQEVRRLTDGK